MNDQIFRKKSLDRISSPDKLDEYLKISTPNLWLLLFAILALLLGVFVWASVGKLETTISCVASVKDRQAEIVLSGSDAEKIKPGMTVRMQSGEEIIETIDFDEFERAVASFECKENDGNYKAEIVLESVHPISFLFR